MPGFDNSKFAFHASSELKSKIQKPGTTYSLNPLSLFDLLDNYALFLTVRTLPKRPMRAFMPDAKPRKPSTSIPFIAPFGAISTFIRAQQPR